MRSLVLGFYGEGPTDERVLPPIIRRTAYALVARSTGGPSISVEDPAIVRPPQRGDQVTRILAAARLAVGYHALIVHADADAPDPAAALAQRLQPGFAAVAASPDARCRDLVPIIPVRTVEAWMLADPEALRRVLNSALDAAALGVPAHAAQFEQLSDPKAVLAAAMQRAYPTRSRRPLRINPAQVQAELGEEIALDRLADVPAYRRFVADLTRTLQQLHMVGP